MRAAALIALVSTAAFAEEEVTATAPQQLLRRVGVGANLGLAGTSGLSVRFLPLESLGLELALAASLQNLGRNTEDFAAYLVGITLNAALHGEWIFLSKPQGFLSAFGGVRMWMFGAAQLGFTLGLKGEWLVWSHMSINLQTGVTLRVHLRGGGAQLDLGPSGAPFAGIGFSLWLP